MENQFREDSFSGLEEKLGRNVYNQLKGHLRLTLLLRDIEEFVPHFSGTSKKSVSLLDVGGGAGQFAEICANKGHKVLLLDSSEKMIEEGKKRLAIPLERNKVRLLQADFLQTGQLKPEYDLVTMHGSAEWMKEVETAVKKGVDLVRPGGVFSLLIFNRNRHILKRGIGGQLLKSELSNKTSKLTPPGARSAEEVERIFQKLSGNILLQSGIRIFHGFFRSVTVEQLAPDDWLEQEIRYYRTEPFASLGEHTHFLFKPEG